MSHTPVIQKLKAHTRRGQALARVAAAGWSARRATSDADRVRASRVLADVLGEARGLPMKFGQAFADPSDQGAFTTLTTSVEPLPLATVEPVIAEALAAAPSRIFEDLDPVGIAASLGQVHRARLRDGGEVAVKVQYPNIAVAMQTELGVLGWLPGFGPARRWGVDLDGYRTMLTSALEEELDYRGEAARQRAFREANTISGLVVPEVLEAFATPTVMVQRWEPGLRISALRTWPLTRRQKVAEILARTLVRSLFVTGLVHGDLHAGNVRARHRDGKTQVVLYDFGSVVTLDDDERAALTYLVTARFALDDANGAVAVRRAMAALGFDAERLSVLGTNLLALTSAMLAPFRSGRPFDLSAWNLGEEVRGLVGDDRWSFRAAAPPRLLRLVRALQGAFALMKTLDVAVDFSSIFDMEVGTLATSAARDRFEDVPAVAAKVSTPQGPQLRLRVRVCDGGRPVVDMTMPGRAALNLAALMPESVISQARARDLSIESISQRLEAEGLSPQELFTTANDYRTCRVWLEGADTGRAAAA